MSFPPSLQGLSTQEAQARMRQGLSNRARPTAWLDYAVIASRHLFTLFNFVVVPTAIALFSYGDWRSGVSVTGTAIANTIIGLFQEWRAKTQLDQLAILTARKARVRRDGRIQDIPVDDVVQGDMVLLRAGETVIADGPLLEAQYLEVDEALLTGESDPVKRQSGEGVLSGSICISGEGIYLAEKVGDKAFAQSVTSDAKRYQYTSSPITIAANRIIFVLSVTALALCGLYLVLAQWDYLDPELMFQMIAATIVSMVPQGLVLTATVSFTLGAMRIAKQGALVQRLNAVEAMAAVNVICTDKTGTLTSNRLKLSVVHRISQDLLETEVNQRLAWFASASIDRENKNIHAIRLGMGEVVVEVLDQAPFNARTRYSAVRVKDKGAEYVLVLGAPEVLAKEPGPWNMELNRLQALGLRVLMFSEGNAQSSAPLNEILPALLRPVALIALEDELRPDAAKVLKALSDQGIQFKAISGDNPITVRATISPLNLPMSREPVVSGADLAAATDTVAFVQRHSVFGRIEPLQKVLIVSALQQGGANVAMIGDGVNDVLSIKKADLGIAMGEGSQAAKTVSSLILETNDFAVLPEAIAEGRTIVRNLRRASKLFLTKNVYSLVFILAYAVGFYDLPFPYLPTQVSLLNWMTIGVPALLIACTLERSSTQAKTSFLSDVTFFSLRTGLVFALTGLTLLVLGKHVWGYDEMTQRTMLLSTIILSGMTVLWGIFGGESTPLKTDVILRRVSLVIMPVLAIAMYWPLAADFFQLTPLNLAQWIKVFVGVGLIFGLNQLLDKIFSGTNTAQKSRIPQSNSN